MSLPSCRILELPKISDRRGSLTFAEAGRHVPFAIKRIFYLFDVPAGEMRAAHALRTCQQVIVAISGTFDVRVDDGKAKEDFHLDRPDCGLYVPPLIWREIAAFSPKAVCMVMASEFYDEADYLDEYAAFKAAVGAQKK
jgi:dTDP-4-dehydrorhamnose 3,5-epimerase-like enzyme